MKKIIQILFILISITSCKKENDIAKIEILNFYPNYSDDSEHYLYTLDYSIIDGNGTGKYINNKSKKDELKYTESKIDETILDSISRMKGKYDEKYFKQKVEDFRDEIYCGTYTGTIISVKYNDGKVLNLMYHHHNHNSRYSIFNRLKKNCTDNKNLKIIFSNEEILKLELSSTNYLKYIENHKNDFDYIGAPASSSPPPPYIFKKPKPWH